MDDPDTIEELRRRLATAEATARETATRYDALRESEEWYRTLFETMGQGFCELQLVRDGSGRAIDHRYLKLNPAFQRLSGIQAEEALGRTANEMFPDLEPSWHETYERIANGGAPERIEHHLASLGRWYEIHCYPREGDRLTLLYEDITARKRAEMMLRESEERQAFLLELSDALRSIVDPVTIQATAARILGQKLNIAVVTYSDVEADEDTFTIHGEYNDGRMPSLVDRRSRLSDHGPGYGPTLRAGETIVYSDIRQDPQAHPEGSAESASMSLVAGAAVPLIKGGRLVAFFSFAHPEPHAWREAEIQLLREVAERTWAAVERARAEERLRISDERFQQFAAASASALWIRDAATLHLEYVSPAIARIYGIEPAVFLDGVKLWAASILPEDRGIALEHLEQARQGKAVVHEFRIQRPSDGAFRWIRNTDFPLFDAHGRVQRIGGIAEDVTEAKLSTEHTGVLLAELQHRVRNIMGMIRSMANRTAPGAADTEDYRTLMEGRLLALSRVQALLTREANAGGSLRSVIESEIAAQAHHGGQFALTGPEIQLPPKAVEVLTLAFHELATNALKYGALSVPEGRLTVSWTLIEKRGKPWVSLDWSEKGAPSREPATRRGFGSELIEARIPYELGGRGTITVALEGAHCHLEFPLKEGESILETDAPQPATVFGGTLDMTGAPDLTGRTVLVVEDDYFMATDTAKALRGAGAKVLGPCPNEEATRDLLEDETPTHAVLDLNLGGGGPRFEIAHLLKGRGIPFVFLTGYDPDVIPADMADVVRLQKPLPFRDIVEAVGQL